MNRLRPLLAVLAVAATGGALAGCGESDFPDVPAAADATIVRHARNAKVSLTIGSKNFTEQRVLGEVYAEGLRAAGYKVRTRLGLGDQDAALAAVTRGEVDGYPEYTGTALVAFFGVRPSRLPSDARQAYQQASRGFASRRLVALPPTPFSDSNAVAVTQETADRHGLRRISDLRRVAGRLTLAGSPECRRRTDCLLGLQQVYGLRFKRFVRVPVGRRHDVLASGRADVSIVFTTDPQIKRDDEVLLRDDRHMFPPYNATLVMRSEAVRRAGPDLGRTVRTVNSALTTPNMQELNARVDLDREEPGAVAREYLRETGLMSGS